MASVARLLLPVAELCCLTIAWLTRSQRWRLLFDSDFYQTSNPSRIPALHFIFIGRYRGQSPHPLFDPAYYVHRNPEVRPAGWEPFAHFFQTGLAENRRSHPLFDPEYYLSTAGLSPSVPALLHFLSQETGHAHVLFDRAFYQSSRPAAGASGGNSLIHYLRYGWKEGRNPHPLFDGAFYLEANADARDSDINPLLHYVIRGGLEGRSPHPLFDGRYYLTVNPDVAAAHVNPLIHFLTAGAAQGRNPSPGFNTLFYLEENRAEVNGLNPLVHYVLAGRQQGKAPLPDIERYLPVCRRDSIVDIVVPVYGGRRETIACIESLLACGAHNVPSEIIAINDGSPDAELIAALKHHAGEGTITLLENDSNRGFPWTANRGMELHPQRDVVLLNSDTVVANDWLTRLRTAAYSSKHTGTATPFTNNGSICSYPQTLKDNTFSPEETASMDAVFREANAGRTHQIPTAVGFCMYIRRDCLDDTGFFDADAFGAGYGEENDFCMRASARGWTHILAADVFIYHRGEVSFSASARERQARAFELVCRRHPRYTELVAEHIRLDPAAPSRTAAAVLAFRQSAASRTLLVTSNTAGERQHTLVMKPLSTDVVQVVSADRRYPISVAIRADRLDDIAKLLKECDVSRVQIQDADWLPHGLYRLLLEVSEQFSPQVFRPGGLRPRRVAALLSHDGTGRFDACAYVRVLLPFRHDSVSDLVQLIPIDSAEWLDDSFDAVLVQRTAAANDAAVDRILRWAERSGGRVIYETDDDLLAISETHPDWLQYRDTRSPIRRLIAHADAVIVSTAELAKSLVSLTRRTIILPNALDERLWLGCEDEKDGDPGTVRVLYMGTMTHGEDLRLIRDAVERLEREMKFRLELVGVTADAREGWYDPVAVPPDTASSYPEFVRWLKRQHRWQFAVAPLECNVFNRAKSHLKYLDYAALGLPGVYSDVQPYSGAVKDGVTGILTGNSTDAWYQALSGVCDVRLRKRISATALADLKANHTLAAQRDQRRRICCEVVGPPG